MEMVACLRYTSWRPKEVQPTGEAIVITQEVRLQTFLVHLVEGPGGLIVPVKFPHGEGRGGGPRVTG